ncbi:MAG: hypothetical protein ACKO24_03965 [Leptolyngbyaceae cyanobacterium]
MHDNKIRLSPDVLQKADQIASEWGLKNARAAVEAVFRRYADDYLYGSSRHFPALPPLSSILPGSSATAAVTRCEALNELDELLGL